MSAKMLRLSLLCVPLVALSACGEGWEAQKTDTYFPYGNQRTAGYGVVYVRAKMMPEKELKIEEPAAEKQEPIKEEPKKKELKPADEIFNDAQTKGAQSAVRGEDKQASLSDGVKHEAVSAAQNEVVVKESAAPAVDVASESKAEASVKTAHSAVSDGVVSAEEYISQAPKQIDIPKVKFVDDPVEAELSEQPVSPPPEKLAYDHADEEDGDLLERYEASMETEVQEVIAPKKTFLEGHYDGYRSLDEIYEDPF